MTCISFLVQLLVFVSLIPNWHAFSPTAATTHHATFFLPSSSRLAASSSKDAIDWFTSEPLESLLPQQDALAIISELLSNETLLDDAEELTWRNWDSLEARLRNETRSARQVLGPDTTNRILKSVETLEGYDPDAVREFLESEAVNSLFARILYDGIFEFFQKIDVFGNIVNSLPIIGPIRKQIVTETKRQLDRSLGPLVQSFLATYTKVAVKEASDFILSPDNTKAFGSANVKLVSSILQRPINTLLPPSTTNSKWKEDVFGYLRNANMTEVERYLELVYDFAGDKSVDRVVNVDRLLDASPTLQETVDRIWGGAVNAKSTND